MAEAGGGHNPYAVSVQGLSTLHAAEKKKKQPAELSDKAKALQSYLAQQYGSGGGGGRAAATSAAALQPKKKKKKKVVGGAAAGVKILDEDVTGFTAPAAAAGGPGPSRGHAGEEEEEEEEDQPVVANVEEAERLKRIIEKERQFYGTRDDGSGWKVVGGRREAEPGAGDVSPLRRGRHDSPDASPPRRRPAAAAADASPPRRARHDSPASPRRRARHDSPDASPPRRRPPPAAAAAADVSPPRRVRHGSPDASPPRRARQPIADTSPPRRRPPAAAADASPPWRARHDSPDASPPRRRAPAANASPPRRAGQPSADASPPRRPAGGGGDLSPPRRRPEAAAAAAAEEAAGEAGRGAKRLKLSDGAAAGMMSGRELMAEMQRKRAAEQQRFAELGADVTGRGAQTVFRDREGRRVSKEEYLEQQEAAGKKKKAEFDDERNLAWGGGLAQRVAAEERGREMAAEAAKPFARYADDKDLDAMQRSRVRWGDPMAHLVKRQAPELEAPASLVAAHAEKLKKSGFIIPLEVPPYSWLRRGVGAPINRYGIRPGRHWDGVDRSNGFEADMFKRQNELRWKEQQAYMMAQDDM